MTFCSACCGRQLCLVLVGRALHALLLSHVPCRFSGSQSTVSAALNSLVSQGVAKNEAGTYRYVGGKATPTPSRATPARAGSVPAARSATPSFRPATPSASSGAGDGASAGDEAAVVALLKNYAGLTVDRAYNMLRNSGK